MELYIPSNERCQITKSCPCVCDNRRAVVLTQFRVIMIMLIVVVLMILYMIMHNQLGGTALQYAAGEGHTAVVTVLLDRGANIDSTDNVSNTVFVLDE